MAKRPKKDLVDFETVVSDKFRTTPIAETIRRVSGLPQSAILYKCAASSFWQFRVFLEGKQRKRSTKEEELAKAQRAAKLIYADMLQSVHAEETPAQPTTQKTLQLIANSLWAKNETRIKNGELHKDKVSKDKYVFDRHIRPFFGGTDIKRIDTDMLEEFKTYLANKDLSPATQLSYINLVMTVLKQAQIKRYITHLPPKPKFRVDDEARGYFDGAAFNTLMTTAHKKVGSRYEFKSSDGAVYRRVTLTEELIHLIEFMVNTYVRPTDIAVLKHKHVHEVMRERIKFIELRHPSTKRHKNFMLGSELARGRYLELKAYHEATGLAGPDNYLFMPEQENRETALDALASQFTALLELSGLRRDEEGKPRTLYSLRHTAIVSAIKKGLPLEMIAANARTSSDMIRRFYGSHVKSVLYMGSAFVDAERSLRDKRYDFVNNLAKEIGFDYVAEEDDEAEEEEAAAVMRRRQRSLDRKRDS